MSLPPGLRLLLEPPAPGPFAELSSLNRWQSLLGWLESTWATSPDAARAAMPEALALLEAWPDAYRPLPGAWFDRIGAGKDSGVAGACAPLFRRLDLWSGGRAVKFKPKNFARFFAHPVAHCLREIELCNTHLPTAMAELVARSPALSGLRSLSFDRTRIGAAGIAALARSPHLAGLEAFNVYMAGLDAASLEALLRAPFLDRLASLDIGGSPLDDEAIEALASCPRLAALRELKIQVSELSERSARLLLDSPHLASLALLDLRDNNALGGLTSPRPSLTLLVGRRS